MARKVTKYEGSAVDNAEDRRGAGLLNITPSQYEQTLQDRLQDVAGQRRLNAAKTVRALANVTIATHRGNSSKARNMPTSQPTGSIGTPRPGAKAKNMPSLAQVQALGPVQNKAAAKARNMGARGR